MRLVRWIFTIHEIRILHKLMSKQTTLRPSDIVIACQLAIKPASQFSALSEATGISVGECHNAVRRLGSASLLSPVVRRPASELLLRFLVHGVPHAFPPQIGPPAPGVPTALAAPVFANRIATSEALVWPDLDGESHGPTLTPLYPGATRLPVRNPQLYDLLALVDGLRVAQVREKRIAEELLSDRLLAREPDAG
jgi:hypothetical protein